jgi:hypothetical protein
MPEICDLFTRYARGANIHTVIAKTAHIRRKISFLPMKILNPHLVREVSEMLECTMAVPRPFTKNVKDRNGDRAVSGAEIGFGYGHNAESILQELNIQKLYCIDPYLTQPYGYDERFIFRDTKQSKYSSLKEDKRVEFIKKTSDEAFRLLPTDLDFIYIDGLHRYEYVLRDLRNSYYHVKSKGIFGGHDFGKQFENEVISAALDFSLEIHQKPKVQMPDYWFTKQGQY